MTFLPIVQNKEAVQQYEVAQLIEFASGTMLKVTADGRRNFKHLMEVDGVGHDVICSLTGLCADAPSALKSGSLSSISLRNAGIINAYANRTIFKINLEDIKNIHLFKSVPQKLKELLRKDSQMSFTSIAREINIPRAADTLSRINRGVAKTFNTSSARAIDDFFNRRFQTMLFDVNNLFTRTVAYVQSKEYVQSKLQEIASKVPLSIKTSEITRQKKRPREYQEKIPKNRSSKRTKSSNGTSNHHLQGLNSIPSQIPFAEQIPYQEAELTTQNFNRGDPSWLSDSSLSSGNGSFSAGETYTQPPYTNETGETAPSFYQEPQVNYSLPQWNGYNTEGEAYAIQPPDTNETGETAPSFYQEPQVNYSLPQWNGYNTEGEAYAIQPPDTNETGETAPSFNQEQQVIDPLSEAFPGNYFSDLNSMNNNAFQFAETILHEETELTTLNFNQDDQFWVSDPLTSEIYMGGATQPGGSSITDDFNL